MIFQLSNLIRRVPVIIPPQLRPFKPFSVYFAIVQRLLAPRVVTYVSYIFTVNHSYRFLFFIFKYAIYINISAMCRLFSVLQYNPVNQTQYKLKNNTELMCYLQYSITSDRTEHILLQMCLHTTTYT